MPFFIPEKRVKVSLEVLNQKLLNNSTDFWRLSTTLYLLPPYYCMGAIQNSEIKFLKCILAPGTEVCISCAEPKHIVNSGLKTLLAPGTEVGGNTSPDLHVALWGPTPHITTCNPGNVTSTVKSSACTYGAPGTRAS